MFSNLIKAFRATGAQPSPKDLAKSVCVVAIQKPGTGDKGFALGNGVFLRKDIVLTCLHNIQGADEVLAVNYKGQKAWGQMAAYSKDLDSAIIKLDTSLACKTAEIGGDTEDYLHDMKANMVTYYHGAQRGDALGKPAIYPVGIDKGVEEGLHIPHNSIRRTFASSKTITHGYSGSPIYDSRGLLSSLACSVIFNYETFQGVTPHRLADFVAQALEKIDGPTAQHSSNKAFDNKHGLG